MLSFVEKLVLAPEQIGRADIDALRSAGVATAAIRDAAYVCALFCMIVRIADALHWDVPASFASSRQALVKFGYKLPPLL